MDEQQLRMLVRQAIARHLGPSPAREPLPSPVLPTTPAPSPAHATPATARFVIARTPGEVECIIEPSVTCNHCGHCLCYGH